MNGSTQLFNAAKSIGDLDQIALLRNRLHFEDIRHLLEVLSVLVDRGNTVVVIEHNLDVIKTADHIIDLGPEGGTGGGAIVAEGTPEEIVRIEASHTGQALRAVLGNGARGRRRRGPAPRRRGEATDAPAGEREIVRPAATRS